MPHHESLRPEANLSIREKAGDKISLIENKRLSAVADEAAAESKRNSQVSTTSTISITNKGKRKTHVGPWQLGKTLGKGATGRVRLAKHALTGQTAAIKIVSKKSAALVQSASMAQMDKDDTATPNPVGLRTMPFGIEREVVIMKLIEHPNIIRLYDIWENRGELYLVMEYVEGGELFDYVSSNGALPEDEAVRLFRQMIAGLSYCHSFNICHRDLKPENILIDKKRNVKLADFGMAALQPTEKMLTTSCGSPHYAAPEVISGKRYRGDKADVWSSGIILFAMLNGFLPFDGGPDIYATLNLVKKGDYYLPPSMSVEAADLVQRMLQKQPENRITMDQIWKHPLIKKYERYHASLVPEGRLIGPPPTTVIPAGGQIKKRSDIDPEILRNLRTLWHGEKQEELVRRLMSDEPDHVKLFYHALVKFREEQLENYPGDPLHYSASDYHHVTKPPPKLPKRSANGYGIGHARRQSQFSIVSDEGYNKNGYYKDPATSASKTTQGSYDPFRSSRTPIVDQSTTPATIIVRRGTDASRGRSASHAATLRHPAVARLQSDPPVSPSKGSEELGQLSRNKRKSYSSRSSLASSRRHGGMRKSASYKRCVSFSHERQNSSSGTAGRSTLGCPDRMGSLSGSSNESRSRRTSYGVSETQSTPSLPAPLRTARVRKLASELDIKRPRVTSGYWKDDARKVSAELSVLCEEAFNRSSVSTASEVERQHATESPATTVSAPHERPLPDLPLLSELTAKRQRTIETWGAEPSLLAKMLVQIDSKITEERDRLKVLDQRSASDPTQASTYGHGSRLATTVTTSTMEDLMRHREYSNRAASEPVRMRGVAEDNTIRLVSPDASSPMTRAPALNVRKNKAMPINSLRDQHQRAGFDPRFYGAHGLDTIEEVPQSPRKKGAVGSPTTARNWSWLGKRSSKNQDDMPLGALPKNHPLKADVTDSQELRGTGSVASSSACHLPTIEQEPLDTQENIEKKKKWFTRMFGKGVKGKDNLQSLSNEHEIINDVDDESEWTGSGVHEVPSTKGKKVVRKSYPPATSVEAAVAAAAMGPIEINQNWFAKFFHIKPATRVICLRIHKMRARKEVMRLLRDWRRYGLEGVVHEKRVDGDVIRARVDAANCMSPKIHDCTNANMRTDLHLKPVHFHAYLYTVAEHGKKASFSVLKFTQEKGAASSFYKVVDTLEHVLKERGLLVTDPVKRKGIERSLKESGY